jgi:hypothetical protein
MRKSAGEKKCAKIHFQQIHCVFFFVYGILAEVKALSYGSKET